MEDKMEKTTPTSLAQLHEFIFKDLHRIVAGINPLFFFFSSIWSVHGNILIHFFLRYDCISSLFFISKILIFFLYQAN